MRRPDSGRCDEIGDPRLEKDSDKRREVGHGSGIIRAIV